MWTASRRARLFRSQRVCGCRRRLQGDPRPQPIWSEADASAPAPACAVDCSCADCADMFHVANLDNLVQRVTNVKKRKSKEERMANELEQKIEELQTILSGRQSFITRCNTCLDDMQMQVNGLF